jgi:tetraacyldisaccharide 4'-kinase
LTRVDQCADENLRGILSEIRGLGVPDPPIEVAFGPTGLTNWAGERKETKSLGGHVAAFCGIGNPEGFRRTLAITFQPNPVPLRIFPDHHAYRKSDLAQLADWARACGADALVTTQKDLVKIPQPDLEGVPLWAMTIEARIQKAQEDFFFSRLDALTHPLTGSSYLRPWHPGGND